MTLTITAFYTGIYGLYIARLTVNVIRYRIGLKIPIGEGTSQALKEAIKSGNIDDKEIAKKYLPIMQAVRAHGNFLEQIVPNVILLALLEYNGFNPTYLHGLYIALTISRVLHTEFGIRAPDTLGFGRALGTVASIGVTVIASILNIANNYSKIF